MKLTYEDKIEIYQLRKQGKSLKNFSQIYDIAVSNIKYLVRLIDRYGIEIVFFFLKSLLFIKTKAGWQYQHDSYHQFLESKSILPSMSRKRNSADNGMMESFFGILKSEMFYGFEKEFKSLEELEKAIINYIDYYNNKCIKIKLDGLSPVNYRITHLNSACIA